MTYDEARYLSLWKCCLGHEHYLNHLSTWHVTIRTSWTCRQLYSNHQCCCGSESERRILSASMPRNVSVSRAFSRALWASAELQSIANRWHTASPTAPSTSCIICTTYIHVSQKKHCTKVLAISLLNIDRLLNFFACYTQDMNNQRTVCISTGLIAGSVHIKHTTVVYDINISQGSVVMRWRCGEIFNKSFIANFPGVWQWKNVGNRSIISKDVAKSFMPWSITMQYYRAVAPSVGATGKPQLVLCSQYFTQSNKRY